MTTISSDTIAGTHQIQSFNDDGILVDGTKYVSSLIIGPSKLAPWRPSSLSELVEDDFLPLLSEPDALILIGLGRTSQLPPLSIMSPFFEKKRAIEWMDSGSACRTYQLLRAEDRPVIAGILVR